MTGRDTWGGHWSSSWLSHWSPGTSAPSGAFVKNVLNPFEAEFNDGTDFHKAVPQIEKKTRARQLEEARLAKLEAQAEIKLQQIEVKIEEKQQQVDNRASRRALASLNAQHHRTQARIAEIQADLVKLRVQVREEDDEDEALLLLLAYH